MILFILGFCVGYIATTKYLDHKKKEEDMYRFTKKTL